MNGETQGLIKKSVYEDTNLVDETLPLCLSMNTRNSLGKPLVKMKPGLQKL